MTEARRELAECTPVYLSAPCYELGELVAIESLTDVSPALRESLRQNGFVRCAVSSASTMVLARRAIERLLHEVDMQPGHIDAVVYATCSYWSDDGRETSALPPQLQMRDRIDSEVLRPLGIERAAVWGVCLAESGNFASALRVARNMVAAQEARTVLVVTADKVPLGEGEYRAMPSAVTINSDGAAACLVTADERPGYRIEAIAQSSEVGMTSFAKGEGRLKYIAILNGLRKATRRAMEVAETKPSDYLGLIVNNYGLKTVQAFADATGFSREQLYVDNVARTGHVFSADALIALSYMLRERALTSDDRFMVLSTGPLTWGALSLRSC